MSREVSGLVFFGLIWIASGSVYYAVRPFQRNQPPLYGSIYAFNAQSLAFRYYANFSFHIDDNVTDLYFFESGPVATTNNSVSTVYFPIQCGTAFQRLLLIAYDMATKNYRQSPWILNNGAFHMLHYDPLRQRLIGLRDHSTFTLILEEYNLTTLSVIKEYTRQDGEQYAFPYAWCSIFDYNENWIVQVRTRFENPSVNAYYVKMDLNLVGKQTDIVTDFRMLPDVHNLCTMTYDIDTKTVLATWQHGSIDQDMRMVYMDPYTGAFRNETLLLQTGSGSVIQSIEAIYNSQARQVLFMIDKEAEDFSSSEKWMILVQFHTMAVLERKQVDTISGFDLWQFFLL